MQEVLPGLYHWTAVHPRIGVEVDSYWLDGAGVLIDPLLPAEGIEWFAARASAPSAILLTNRHHYRQSDAFAKRFGCTVRCSSRGLHEFAGGDRAVEGFEPGETLPGGAVAYEVDAICPDETALHLPEHGALAIADGVVLGGPHGQDGLLGFVPDSLMDDPEKTKAGLLAAYARLLAELDFEHLLLAHGGPLIGDGRARLQELIDVGGRTAFEM